MDLWKEKASGPLHIIHVGYGIGSFLVPQILAPFISEKLPTKDTMLENGCADNISNLSNTINITDDTSKPSSVPPNNLQIGFWIVSAMVLGIAGIWLGYFLFDKQKYVQGDDKDKRHATVREYFNPANCAPGNPTFAVLMHVLIFMWTYSATALERIYGKYLFSYVREEACFSKQEATNLLTAFWICGATGRFLGFIISNFVPMRILVFVEGLGNLACALIFFILEPQEWLLWICVCASSIFIGPCVPSGLALANRYMSLTATSVAVVTIGAGISELSALPAVGSTIDSTGISSMISFTLGFAVVSATLPFVMQSLVCGKADRFEQEQSGNNNDMQ